MKAIITVNAQDTVGIIAFISSYLARHGVNILDISQTIMQDFFVMIMLVDISGSDVAFDELRRGLLEEGRQRSVTIHIQRDEIFEAMHRI